MLLKLIDFIKYYIPKGNYFVDTQILIPNNESRHFNIVGDGYMNTVITVVSENITFLSFTRQ